MYRTRVEVTTREHIEPRALRDRARIAVTRILHTPREVAAFLHEVALARARREIRRGPARQLRQGGRLLLKGTVALKAQLRRAAQDS